MICAAYDFAVSPASYEIIDFLCGVRRFADGPAHILLIPGPYEGFKCDRKPISAQEKRWRVMHVVIPVIRAAGMTFTVCPSREFAAQFEIGYPTNYSIHAPVPAHGMKMRIENGPVHFAASPRAKEIAGKWLDEQRLERPLVTVTLRETYTEKRNSNVETWLSLAEKWHRSFAFVFLRDTARMTEPLPDGFLSWPLASLDFDLRLALYDRAALNAGRVSAPLGVCLTDGARPHLTFHPVFPDKKDAFCPTAEFLGEAGLPVGSQLPWFTSRQRIVWEPDDPDIVEREFHEMVCRLGLARRESVRRVYPVLEGAGLLQH